LLAGFPGDEAECFRHTTHPDHPEARSRLVESLSRAEPSDTRRDYLKPAVFRILDSEDATIDQANDAPRVRRLRGNVAQGLLRRGESLELVAGNYAEPVKIRRIERNYGEAEQVYPGDSVWAHVLLPWWANPGEGSALAAPNTLQGTRQVEVFALLLPRATAGRRTLRGAENVSLAVDGASFGASLLPGSEWFYEGQEQPLSLRLAFSRPVALATGSRVSLLQDGARLGPGVVTRLLAEE
jgi:translation elongation factor EF-Tu-like GTPase